MKYFLRSGLGGTLLMLAICLPVLAQSPAGRWKTVDDETGETRSIIEITQQNGSLTGTVVELINPAEPDPICEKCSDERKNHPILGMTILWDMAPEGDEWAGGRLLDPENGNTYRGKLWLESEDVLRVRGYQGPFRRTQTWYRAD